MITINLDANFVDLSRSRFWPIRGFRKYPSIKGKQELNAQRGRECREQDKMMFY